MEQYTIEELMHKGQALSEIVVDDLFKSDKFDAKDVVTVLAFAGAHMCAFIDSDSKNDMCAQEHRTVFENYYLAAITAKKVLDKKKDETT